MFRFEKDMIPIIRNGLEATCNLNYLNEEFPTGLGYVDIAGSKTIKKRKAYALDIEMVYILSNYLNRKNKKLSIQRIKEKHNIKGEVVARAINYLELNDFVHSDDKGELYLTQRLEPAIDELYTVEAKLNDWKSALFQARRNKLFATRSYVAFPSNKITKEKIELCKANNIGLIAVCEDSINICHKPKMNSRLDATNFYYTAEVFSQRIVKNIDAPN